MIRFCNKIFEDYSICPATGDIFDKNGAIQPIKVIDGRPTFRCMPVHRIQVHTYLGYRPKMDIHHLNGNKFDNQLSNLVYLTRSEHIKIHATVFRDDEIIAKLADSNKKAWSDPVLKAKHSAIIKRSHGTKEYKEKTAIISKLSQNKPEVKAKKSKAITGLYFWNNRSN